MVRHSNWLFYGIAAAALLLFAGIDSVPSATAHDSRNSALPGEIPEAVKKPIEFDKAGKKPAKPYRIAYLTECVTNTYCEARMKGLQDAANKFGFTFKF